MKKQYKAATNGNRFGTSESLLEITTGELDKAWIGYAAVGL